MISSKIHNTNQAIADKKRRLQHIGVVLMVDISRA